MAHKIVEIKIRSKVYMTPDVDTSLDDSMESITEAVREIFVDEIGEEVLEITWEEVQGEQDKQGEELDEDL